MKIKTVIIEDEEKSLYVLQELINEFAKELTVCGTASHIGSAVELIETMTPQLAFIDIRIADGTGFDLLRKLSFRNFEIIFVTAYDSYALDAFRVAAIDYLLKPLGIEEFEAAVQRALKRLAEKTRFDTIEALLYNLSHSLGKNNKLCIPILNGYEFVDPLDILWCKSEGAYTTFYLTNKSTITSSRNIGTYENFLNQINFCRIHNSAIVNMHWIKRYVKGKGGCVVLTDGTQLEVSQRRKDEFMDKISL
ncbi:MAG TPA: LytTR family DNA-binding domain-containing protein [Puia sp.]|nr:LytTR family DNA-binding domain-containing protein [Puia sp.]